MRKGGLLIKGFTLIETIIVIVIISILVTLALAQYGSYRETTLDKEARANLKLIIAAERIYRMTAGGYYPMASGSISDMNAINTGLRLFLSTVPNRRWNYATTANNATSAACVQATRTGAAPRNWRMRHTEDEPVADAVCP